MEVRLSNMIAAKGALKCPMVFPGRTLIVPWSYAAISDAVRTSLGPRGMDKMVIYKPPSVHPAF